MKDFMFRVIGLAVLVYSAMFGSWLAGNSLTVSDLLLVWPLAVFAAILAEVLTRKIV